MERNTLQVEHLCTSFFTQNGEVKADRQADEMMIRMLMQRINRRALVQDCRQVEVRRASFGEQAALIGALALAIAHVFDGKLSFYPEEG